MKYTILIGTEGDRVNEVISEMNSKIAEHEDKGFEVVSVGTTSCMREIGMYAVLVKSE